MVEVVTQVDGFVRFVAELGVERKHLAKPLIEANVVQLARQRACRQRVFGGLRRERQRKREEQ